MKYLLFVTLLAISVSGAFASEPSIQTKIKAHYQEQSDEYETGHSWTNRAVLILGKKNLVNFTKRELCQGEKCDSEEFRTEILPTRIGQDYFKLEVVFTRSWGQDVATIRGELMVKLGEPGQLFLKSKGETIQKFNLELKPSELKLEG